MPSDEADTVLQLSHFAYDTARSLSSCRPEPGPSRPAPGSGAIMLARKEPQDCMPNSQIAQLSKCIGCGLAWTGKKTANQKRTHLKRCVKKHALTAETVKTLVEKEVAALVPSSHIHSSETSLLDSVVLAGPYKKSKRQQVLATVRSLPETRDSILSKAKDILGPTITQTEQSFQPFGQSALARRVTDRPKYPPAGALQVRPIDEPPSTQPFGESFLCRKSKTIKHSVDNRQYPFGASLFAQDFISIAGHKRQRSASPSSSSG